MGLAFRPIPEHTPNQLMLVVRSGPKGGGPSSEFLSGVRREWCQVIAGLHPINPWPVDSIGSTVRKLMLAGF